VIAIDDVAVYLSISVPARARDRDGADLRRRWAYPWNGSCISGNTDITPSAGNLAPGTVMCGSAVYLAGQNSNKTDQSCCGATDTDAARWILATVKFSA
jgi:hypothetical protein